jgi:hypothetical protein
MHTRETIQHFTWVTFNCKLGAISHSFQGMSFVHCWRPYCDCEMQNSTNSDVPLLKYMSKWKSTVSISLLIRRFLIGVWKCSDSLVFFIFVFSFYFTLVSSWVWIVCPISFVRDGIIHASDLFVAYDYRDPSTEWWHIPSNKTMVMLLELPRWLKFKGM